ncbi:MAG: hypothetical protein M1829_001523 [Trizodia sp. TS-e1964]|nr:MAG: hypothetical protein M1829_001523 [Trizodia sp. TS-e1964]
MATLNLSNNGPSISQSYQTVVNSTLTSAPASASQTYAQWAVYSVSAPLISAFTSGSTGKESILKVQSTGEGELANMIDEFSDGRVQFSFLKVKGLNTALPKCVLIAWCGEGVPERTKGYFTSYLAAVCRIFQGYHVQITARSDQDLTPDSIIQKVSDASSLHYSGTNTPSAVPATPLVSKPVFGPMRTIVGSRSSNQLAFRGPRDKGGDVDADGWGADAPQITRTQLESVEPAYQPTKVNISELTKQGQVPSRLNLNPEENKVRSEDVIKGAYQPIGRVDIEAIRRQAQSSGSTDDDRPTVVKGAYEPVGKVDIAAIRAKARGSSEVDMAFSKPIVAISAAASPTGIKNTLDHSAAVPQTARLTSLPKPKISGRFTSNSENFNGTKPPLPGSFGFDKKPLETAPAPVGAANRSFADDGGKTPSQIWAEKKARQRGLSEVGDAVSGDNNHGQGSSIVNEKNGGVEWKSGYAGKTWAPVKINITGKSVGSNPSQQHDEQEDTPFLASTPPAEGIAALRDRFKDAPITPFREQQSMPSPKIDISTKPITGTTQKLTDYGPSEPPLSQFQSQKEDPSSPMPHSERPNETPPALSPRPVSPIRVALPISRTSDEALVKQSYLQATDRSEPPKIQPDISNSAPRVAPESAVSASLEARGRYALVVYDYEKDEDNELALQEGEHIKNIDIVDESWWMGENSRGETGLFPSNYVELLENEEEIANTTNEVETPSPNSAPDGIKVTARSATAIYDYQAAEGNELSFPEGAKITSVEFPDEDWWSGEHGGKLGLFPANYVQLDE